MTNKEIFDRFKSVIEIYEVTENELHIEDIRWFFDTLPVENQVTLLLMAYNIITCIARREGLEREGGLSAPNILARSIVENIEDMARKMFPGINKEHPMSQVFTMMFHSPYVTSDDKKLYPPPDMVM